MEPNISHSGSYSRLFLCPWNPLLYLKGVHSLVVRHCSNDAEQNCITVISTFFSLQSEQPSRWSLKKWIRCFILFVDAPGRYFQMICICMDVLFGVHSFYQRFVFDGTVRLWHSCASFLLLI